MRVQVGGRAVVSLGLAFASASCSLLFEQAEPSDAARAGSAEHILLVEGNPEVAGSEVYVARTVDGESFIESYSLGPDSTLLPGRIDLPFRPKAMVSGRTARVLHLLGASSPGESEPERDYVLNLTWPRDTAVMSTAVFEPEFPPLVGPSIVGGRTQILSEAFFDQTVPIATGREVRIMRSNLGGSSLTIDEEALVEFDELITCAGDYVLAGSRSDLALFAGTELVVVNGAVDLGPKETVYDLPRQTHAVSFGVEACTQISGDNAFIVSDGDQLRVVVIADAGANVSVTELATLSEGPHEELVGMEVLAMNAGSSPEMVAVTADPPIAYLGLDLLSPSQEFSREIIAQPLPFVPTTMERVPRPTADSEHFERVLIGEANKPPHCFRLGTSSAGLEPALVPCD